MGTTLEDASKNAAVNALTNVVGTFIDSQTLISKKTEISAGIVEKVKNISRDIKSYSQGSISYFEVLEAEEVNGIYRVTARVDVIVEDFKSYIKKYALGQQDMSVGLFANMATEKDQLEEKYNLLVDNIIEPLATAQVYDVELSAPMPFEDSPLREGYTKKLNGLNISERDAIVFTMTVRLDKAFKANMINTLENISDAKREITPTTCLNKNYSGTNYISCGRAEDWDLTWEEFNKSFRLSIFDKESKISEIYLMKDIAQASLTSDLRGLDTSKPYAWITDKRGMCQYRYEGGLFKKQRALNHLLINFLDSSGGIIDAIEIKNNPSYGTIDRWEEDDIGFMIASPRLSGLLDRDAKKPMFSIGNQGHLINRQLVGGTCGRVGNWGEFSQVAVYDELTFWITLKLNQNLLRNAKSFVVEFID